MTNRQYILAIGVILLIVGIIGLFNEPLLLGTFLVNSVHNIVHIVSGILAIVFFVISESAVRNYAKAFGIIYGLVGIIGLYSGSEFILGMAINSADNILHIFLAAIFLALGFYEIKPALRR